jgi:hypothetical protein
LRQLRAQESATEALIGRVSRLEADRAVVGSLSTEVARLKEAQSVLSSEIEKVRQQLRELAVPPKSSPPLAAQGSTASSTGAPAPSGWKSAILADFPKLFEDFKQ